MNYRHYIAVASLIIATTFASTVSASTSTGKIALDVQTAISSGNVNVCVHNGVATLYGNVEDFTDSRSAERAAANFEGIDKVINNLYIRK